MSKQIGLIVNLDLCMGCFACKVACKQEKGLPEGTQGIEVITLGPYEIDGELAMDFLPVATEACDICAERRSAGDRPFCAQICPTKALTVQREDELLKVLRGTARFHICKIENIDCAD
jgi:Fe-S-cluster-containing dehydrogenase component